MAYIIAIGIALILFGSFLALTRLETARGVRFFGSVRGKLDEKVGKAAFVVRHVDWSAFIAHLLRTLSARIAHDVAHTILIIVRVIERLLTRIVKYLRSRRQQVAHMADKPRFDMRASLRQFGLLKKKEENSDVV